VTAPTVVMIAPVGFGGVVTNTPSGTVYTPNAYGQITAVATDVNVLETLGFYPLTVATQPIAQLLGANMNATTDQALTMLLPASMVFVPRRIVVTNASTSLTTAAGGVYDAASKGGNAIVASSQAYSALTTAGAAIYLTIAAFRREAAATKLYLSLTTAQGAAATADVYVYGDAIAQ